MERCLVVYDECDKMYKCRAGWTTELSEATLFIKHDNAKRHCYLDSMVVLEVHVVRTVEVTLVSE